MAGSRKAPYMHTDGSDCYTVNCRLDHAKTPAQQNQAIQADFNKKLDALIAERDRKVEEWQIPEKIAQDEASLPMKNGSPIIDSTDPRVQAGEVLNEVSVDGVVYSRRRDGIYADTPYSMRIQANRPISQDEANHIAGLTGYAYRSTVAGESLGDPRMDSPYSFVVYADMTKSRRDDLGDGISKFEDTLSETIQQGSPVRKTDRSGVGTKGTRLIDGMGDDLEIELYYDETSGF